MPEPFKVDLTNCDREPIHQLGRIQPIGFLVALTSDFLIARVSQNIGAFLPDLDGPTALVGRPATDLFDGEALHEIRNRVSLLRSPDTTERIFSMKLAAGTDPFDISLHIADPAGTILCEAEPSDPTDRPDSASVIRTMMQRLDASDGVQGLLDEGARQIRALMGYDRVMVYRFDAEGSGEVVAERCKAGIGTFKGLHYPASDIPRQARELYKRNIFRVICDVDSEPVPIVPERDPHGAPIDLSMSVLRSVSPIHIEYLRNMGVAASLSISIVVEGRLWGLFACHHYAPRRLSFERRSLAELFAQLFALRLESRLREEQAEYERNARDIANTLMSAVAGDKGLLGDPEWVGDLLTNVIPADGVGIWLNGEYALAGATPSTPDFIRLVNALNTASAGHIFATDHIAGIVEDARSYQAKAAGMLSIPVSRAPRDYVILFREEWVRSVTWAGDPSKPAEYGPHGPRLTPRKSFEAWSELVEGRSRPFTEAETRVAETIRASLIEVILRMSDDAADDRQRAHERQEMLIAELNHRVRNILALIRGLVRRSRPASGDIDDFVRIIDGRIHALSRAHDQLTADHWGPASFRHIIETEAAAYLAGQGHRIESEGPEALLEPTAYSTVALVVHELVTNSAKYGSLSGEGRVLLRWEFADDGDLVVRWREVDGPPVSPPDHRGFGSTIIERSVPFDLDGEAVVEYLPEGLEACFTVPARHVVRASQPAAQKLPRRAGGLEEGGGRKSRARLSGAHVLLVEDSLIIAMDAEDIMAKLGAGSVAVAANPGEALRSLEERQPALALLDINLGSTTSFAVADALEAAEVPYVFATGYGEQAQLPDNHRSRPVLQKPYTLANIARTIDALIEDGELSDLPAAE